MKFLKSLMRCLSDKTLFGMLKDATNRASKFVKHHKP